MLPVACRYRLSCDAQAATAAAATAGDRSHSPAADERAARLAAVRARQEEKARLLASQQAVGAAVAPSIQDRMAAIRARAAGVASPTPTASSSSVAERMAAIRLKVAGSSSRRDSGASGTTGAEDGLVGEGEDDAKARAQAKIQAIRARMEHKARSQALKEKMLDRDTR